MDEAIHVFRTLYRRDPAAILVPETAISAVPAFVGGIPVRGTAVLRTRRWQDGRRKIPDYSHETAAGPIPDGAPLFDKDLDPPGAANAWTATLRNGGDPYGKP